MAGAKPIPIELKKLKEPGKKQIDVPKNDSPLGDPPAHFTEIQKKIWHEACENSPVGVLTINDRTALTIWCTAMDLYVQASLEVQAGGLIVESPVKGDPMQSPALSILNRQAELLLKASSELGFTPASRTKLAMLGQKKPTANKFANNGVK